jgi:hypothetical protein
MHFQFIVAPPTPALTPPASPPSDTSSELLRELLEVQREQLGLMRAVHTESGNLARWKNFFSRWQDEFGHLPGAMRETLGKVEHAYLRLMDDVTQHLSDEDGGIGDDFSLNEFLDRYAMRAAQLGSLLNMLGQMVEAARTED